MHYFQYFIYYFDLIVNFAIILIWIIFQNYKTLFENYYFLIGYDYLIVININNYYFKGFKFLLYYQNFNLKWPEFVYLVVTIIADGIFFINFKNVVLFNSLMYY